MSDHQTRAAAETRHAVKVLAASYSYTAEEYQDSIADAMRMLLTHRLGHRARRSFGSREA